MFDEDQLRRLLASRTPFQRGVAASLAAWRAGAAADTPGVDEYFPHAPGYSALVGDALAFLDRCVLSGCDSAEAAALKERFETLLGPDGEEYEEPEDALPAYAVDAASIADYAVRVWVSPEDSEDLAYTVFSDAYGFTGMLAEDGEPEPAIVEGECGRQLNDLGALEGVEGPMAEGALEVLREGSAEVRELIRHRFEELAERAEG